MIKSSKHAPEIRERAVLMVQKHRKDYPSLWSSIESIAPRIGCTSQSQHDWAKKHG